MITKINSRITLTITNFCNILCSKERIGRGGIMPKERSEKRSSFLFYAAAGTSIALAIWLTLAFFREEFEFRDVGFETVLFGLGIITAYSGHRSTIRYKENCSTTKPGEWIFAALLVWGFVMLSMYQLKIPEKIWEIEAKRPEYFYFFFEGLLGIFGGTTFVDFFMSRKLTGSNASDQAAK